MKITIESQRKIIQQLRAEPVPQGSSRGRVVAKSARHLYKHFEEALMVEPPDLELLDSYDDGVWFGYMRWAEDLHALLVAESEKGGKRQKNILSHAAKNVRRAIDTAERIESGA